MTCAPSLNVTTFITLFPYNDNAAYSVVLLAGVQSILRTPPAATVEFLSPVELCLKTKLFPFFTFYI
ncbi:hypothetical protein AZF37_09590 [endosymbiont 'TC1' of Trimyema compressum]|nr:hypothetical protein AZF37_09590 [endosymbiont 'TC1' of Trimyema compressum]